MRGNLQEVCSLMQRLLDHLVLLYVQLHDRLLQIPAVQMQHKYSTDTVQQYSAPHAAVYQLGAAAARAAAEVVQLHQRRGEAAAGGVQRASRTSSYHMILCIVQKYSQSSPHPWPRRRSRGHQTPWWRETGAAPLCWAAPGWASCSDPKKIK